MSGALLHGRTANPALGGCDTTPRAPGRKRQMTCDRSALAVCAMCGLSAARCACPGWTPVTPQPPVDAPKQPSEPGAMPENAGLYSAEFAAGLECVGCGGVATVRAGTRYGLGPEGSELFPVCAECARVLA